MKILVIEDDQNKRQRIVSHIVECFPSAVVVERWSYQSGLKETIRNGADILILDMTLQTYDASAVESGGRPRIFGGLEILNQISKREIQIPTIVVTMFDSFGEPGKLTTLDELQKSISTQFPKLFAGMVYYDPLNVDWKEKLTNKISRVLKQR